MDDPTKTAAEPPAVVTDPAATLLHSPATTEPAPAPSAGPNVPGYEIERELGRGGMGVVYLARQHRPNRLVALKMVLAGDHASPESLLRFLAEAEAIAKLRHPGIVQVYEVGQHDGRPYFSLEHCPGGSLDQQLTGNPQPPKAAAKLIEQIARAVAAAHKEGIVHRDLKPANVLLSGELRDKRRQERFVFTRNS